MNAKILCNKFLQSQTLPQNWNNVLVGQRGIQGDIKCTDSKRFIPSNVGPSTYQNAGEGFGLVPMVWHIPAEAVTMEVTPLWAPESWHGQLCRTPTVAERAQLFPFIGSCGKYRSSDKCLWPYRHWWEPQGGLWITSRGCSPKSLGMNIRSSGAPLSPCGCLPALVWECLHVPLYKAVFQSVAGSREATLVCELFW